MKKFIRELIGFFLITFFSKVRLKDEEILSLYFHNPPKILFKKILLWLKSKGYDFISIKELENYIDIKTCSGKKAFISFDDGWNGNLELLEIIDKYNVPITIFIVTDAVVSGNFWWEFTRKKKHIRLKNVKKTNWYKKLTEKTFRDQIKILRENIKLKRSCITLEELKTLSTHRLITIGSHSITHPILPNCSRESQHDEIANSKRLLEEWTGKEIHYFAFPNGDYDENVIEIAKNSGYNLCFTIEPESIDIKKVNRFKIPRIAMYDKGGFYENIAKINRVWQKFYHKPKNT